VSLIPTIGNITLKFIWIPSRIIPDNGQNVKKKPFPILSFNAFKKSVRVNIQ
jgi:hypothetical protein